jgi:hypothetical protein
MNNLGLETRNCLIKNTSIFQQTKYKTSKNKLENLQMVIFLKMPNKNETKDKNI